MIHTLYRVRSSKRILGYEWLESEGWKHYNVELDEDSNGELLRTHRGTYSWFNAGCLDRDQYIGLKDKNDKEYYVGDIGEFDNGDKFILKMEGWLEVFVEWIGDPDCEDQTKDLYRISRAKIIGNIYRNPELIK